MPTTHDDWTLLEADNQAERLAYLGTAPGATSHRSTDVTWVVTGVPADDYNGVIWTRMSPQTADLHVPLLVQQFGDQGLPALWHVDPQSEPADLADRLRALGCQPATRQVVMAANLSRLSREMSRFPSLTIDRVRGDDDLADWMAVRRQIAPDTEPLRGELYASLGLGNRQPLHHYLARVDGAPAGVAQLFLGMRAAGLYSVGVAPAFRGRGIGTALVLTPLLVARTLGFDVGVVRPPQDSRIMYEHLGFEDLISSALGYVIGGCRGGPATRDHASVRARDAGRTLCTGGKDRRRRAANLPGRAPPAGVNRCRTTQGGTGTVLDKTHGMTTTVESLPNPFLTDTNALAARVAGEPGTVPCQFLVGSGLETVHAARLWSGRTLALDILIDGCPYVRVRGTVAHCHAIEAADGLRFVVQWRIVPPAAMADLAQILSASAGGPDAAA
jgi:GNAT superfamily N-acetyltransferase